MQLQLMRYSVGFFFFFCYIYVYVEMQIANYYNRMKKHMQLYFRKMIQKSVSGPLEDRLE